MHFIEVVLNVYLILKVVKLNRNSIGVNYVIVGMEIVINFGESSSWQVDEIVTMIVVWQIQEDKQNYYVVQVKPGEH